MPEAMSAQRVSQRHAGGATARAIISPVRRRSAGGQVRHAARRADSETLHVGDAHHQLRGERSEQRGPVLMPVEASGPLRQRIPCPAAAKRDLDAHVSNPRELRSYPAELKPPLHAFRDDLSQASAARPLRLATFRKPIPSGLVASQVVMSRRGERHDVIRSLCPSPPVCDRLTAEASALAEIEAERQAAGGSVLQRAWRDASEMVRAREAVFADSKDAPAPHERSDLLVVSASEIEEPIQQPYRSSNTSGRRSRRVLPAQLSTVVIHDSWHDKRIGLYWGGHIEAIV